MLEKGEQVVHARYGAGVVQGIREMTFAGKTRRYYCIELLDGQGQVMIPEDAVDEADIRTDIVEADFIRRIMNNEPLDLSNNYRTRQANIQKKVASGSPRQVIQALRDLCWRERERSLTITDSRLKTRAMRLVAQELALHLKLDLDTATQRLNEIIRQAMHTHQEVSTG